LLSLSHSVNPFEIVTRENSRDGIIKTNVARRRRFGEMGRIFSGSCA
jgi:hypothetical protein